MLQNDIRGTDAVRHMSVPAGIQAAGRTDSHGHRPQNRLTCANQQAELRVPKRIQPGRTCAEADEPLTGGGYHPIPTRPRALSADTRYPHTADGALALPAKPARQRPAGRAGDPDRPAMYPGCTWHPPPVDLHRHQASPSNHADASDSAEMSARRLNLRSRQD
jgi:hypothetical protein